jgi:putative transposase
MKCLRNRNHFSTQPRFNGVITPDQEAKCVPRHSAVGRVLPLATARVNNRGEDSHQPTRRRERQMCGFRDARRTQAFLSCFGPIRQHFALPGHKKNAACHRAILRERFASWRGWTVTAAVEEVI